MATNGGPILYTNRPVESYSPAPAEISHPDRVEPGEPYSEPARVEPGEVIVSSYTPPEEYNKADEHHPTMYESMYEGVKSCAQSCAFGCGIISIFWFVGGIVMLTLGAVYLSFTAASEGFVDATCSAPANPPKVVKYCLSRGKSCSVYYCCDYNVNVRSLEDDRVKNVTMYRRGCVKSWSDDDPYRSPCTFFETFLHEPSTLQKKDSFPCKWKPSITSSAKAKASCQNAGFIGVQSSGSCNLMLPEEYDFFQNKLEPYTGKKGSWIALIVVGSTGIVWGIVAFVLALTW